ncbi:hypothetical protein MARHY1862 [Marinobacter nauticus ATCC 49840]|nr:hypothetical protein MARHY1862 [Marinobacter nauticus ATCC 49840]
MMTYRLNKGLLWATPLESSYARARRLFVANPGLSLSRLKRVLPQLPSHIYQCPKCADYLFHSWLYDLPCLRLCPIHHCEFRLKCPACGRRWTRVFQARKPSCNTCGALPKEAWGKTWLKRREMRKLSWLARWIERCEANKANYAYVGLMDVQGRVGRHFAQEHPNFFEPNIDNPYYLAFECQRAAGIYQDRLNRMNVVTHNRALRSRISELRHWPKLDWHQSPRRMGHTPESDHPLDVHEAHMLRLITVALRRILRWQKACLGFEHRLVWSDCRHIRPEDVREGKAPCDLCMAFSLWCLLTSLKFTKRYREGVDNEGAHELLRLANYHQMPNIATGVFIEDHQSRTWRPSISFERWLFLRASENAFAEFVSLANWIFVKTADRTVKYKATGYHGLGHIFQPPLYPSHILETRLEEGRLVARYWPESPLLDIKLTNDARDRIRHCHGVGRSDWVFRGSVEPDYHKVHQGQARELFHSVRLPSSRIFEPWIAHAANGYLDNVWFPHDFAVLQSTQEKERLYGRG